MANWIAIDKFAVAEANSKHINNGQVITMAPPHMIPDAVSAYLDHGWIIIDFRYDSISEPQEQKNLNGLLITVGSKTKRLYQIRMFDENQAVASAKKENRNFGLHKLMSSTDKILGKSEAIYSVRKYSNEISNELKIIPA